MARPVLVTVRSGHELLAIHDRAAANRAVDGRPMPSGRPATVPSGLLPAVALAANQGLSKLVGAFPMLHGPATGSLKVVLRVKAVREELKGVYSQEGRSARRTWVRGRRCHGPLAPHSGHRG